MFSDALVLLRLRLIAPALILIQSEIANRLNWYHSTIAAPMCSDFDLIRNRQSIIAMRFHLWILNNFRFPIESDQSCGIDDNQVINNSCDWWFPIESQSEHIGVAIVEWYQFRRLAISNWIAIGVKAEHRDMQMEFAIAINRNRKNLKVIQSH